MSKIEPTIPPLVIQKSRIHSVSNNSLTPQQESDKYDGWITPNDIKRSDRTHNHHKINNQKNLFHKTVFLQFKHKIPKT